MMPKMVIWQEDVEDWDEEVQCRNRLDRKIERRGEERKRYTVDRGGGD